MEAEPEQGLYAEYFDEKPAEIEKDQAEKEEPGRSLYEEFQDGRGLMDRLTVEAAEAVFDKGQEPEAQEPEPDI